MFIEIIFWFLIFTIFYSIFGYPISLELIYSINKPKFLFKKKYSPSVSLLVSTFNEGKVLKEKILNSLQIDYPDLNIVVISDGSKDNTIEICKEFTDVKLFHYDKNEGKNASLNKTLKNITSEIVVFSDANTFYEKDAIKKLVYKISDKKVGCVVGQLKLTQTDSTNTSQGEGIYWKYEHLLKRLESKIGQVLVGNGGIFAAKRHLLLNLQNDIPNDFQIPMDVGRQDFKILYEPDAIALEKTSEDFNEEKNRKIRIVNRNFNGFVKYLNKINGIRLYEMIFHKVIRWITGFLALILLILNLFMIQNGLYLLLFVLQIGFYLAAILGYIFPQKNKLLFIPFYITLIFLSSSIGILQYLFGKNYSKWTPPKTSR